MALGRSRVISALDVLSAQHTFDVTRDHFSSKSHIFPTQIAFSVAHSSSQAVLVFSEFPFNRMRPKKEEDKKEEDIIIKLNFQMLGKCWQSWQICAPVCWNVTKVANF